jgi:putative transposase
MVGQKRRKSRQASTSISFRRFGFIYLDRRRPLLHIRAMPRPVCVKYPGAMYHVMSRGNRRQDIYLDDVDRQDFLKTLADSCQKPGWQMHAYRLMSNRYHLVAETPNANLVAGIAWLQSA